MLAALVPGGSDARAVAAESALFQRDKEGLEIDQGIFVSAVLANPRADATSATRCCSPRRTAERFSELERSGRVDLVRRKSSAKPGSFVVQKNRAI